MLVAAAKSNCADASERALDQARNSASSPCSAARLCHPPDEIGGRQHLVPPDRPRSRSRRDPAGPQPRAKARKYFARNVATRPHRPARPSRRRQRGPRAELLLDAHEVGNLAQAGHTKVAHRFSTTILPRRASSRPRSCFASTVGTASTARAGGQQRAAVAARNARRFMAPRWPSCRCDRPAAAICAAVLARRERGILRRGRPPSRTDRARIRARVGAR